MNISVDSADEYFLNILSSELWFEQDAEKKQAAILMAENKIKKLPFIGTKVADNQIDMFPRLYNGKLINLPDDVVMAIFEEALFLLKQENGLSSELPDGVQSLSLGGASISFKESKSHFKLCDNASLYLDGWLRKGFNISTEKFKEVY